MGGCDKTVPALVMGATSMNLPAIFMPAGPMLRGHWHGKQLGSGSDVWKYWAELRAGNIDRAGLGRDRGRHRPLGRHLHDHGHGVDHGGGDRGLGPHPARRVVDPGRPIPSHARMATASGRRIVEMVWQDVKPRDILTEAAFDNAIATLMAIGGSTNAIIHLVAHGRPRRHQSAARALRCDLAQRRRCSPMCGPSGNT